MLHALDAAPMGKQQALRQADLHLKQKETVEHPFSVTKPDIETQMKSGSAVREVFGHGVLNKTWEEFFSAEIFSLRFWRKMRIVLGEWQGASAAADCCSPLCCHSGSNIQTMTQISKIPRSDF